MRNGEDVVTTVRHLVILENLGPDMFLNFTMTFNLELSKIT